MSEKFVVPEAFVSWLLHALIVEELKLRIGGAAKRACLGDTHVHGKLHGSLGPPRFGGQLLHGGYWDVGGILKDENELRGTQELTNREVKRLLCNALQRNRKATKFLVALVREREGGGATTRERGSAQMIPSCSGGDKNRSAQRSTARHVALGWSPRN